MNFNTFLLCLLVIAAYLNLYLTHKKSKKNKTRTKLPISSKEWSDRKIDKDFKDWLSNRKSMKK